jgi:hypothetical protein
MATMSSSRSPTTSERALLGAVAALVAGCYAPGFDGVRCSLQGECPDGFECRGDVCVRPSGPDGSVDAPADDGAALDSTTQPDGTEACVAWGATLVDPCDPELPPPTHLVVTGQSTLDTDTGVLTPAQGNAQLLPSILRVQVGGPRLRIVNLSSLDIASGTSVRVTGQHALVVVVHGNAQVAGALSVSSAGGSAPTAGPGASDTACGGAGLGKNGMGSGSLSPGGGSGGGAYGGDGGDGSDGYGPDAGNKGARGTRVGTAALVPLHGGCRGGRGGDTSLAGDQGGAPGSGGGAIALTVRETLSVSGAIEANGSGGRGGLQGGGGAGGGGSGGAIFLEAANVLVTGASLCANGGGGGEGGDRGISPAAGGPGADGTCTATAATGGATEESTGGPGGRGGATDQNAEAADEPDDAGGGGGGGGVGRIRLRGISMPADAATAALVSPAAVLE